MNKKSSIINTAIHVGIVGGWKWGRIDRYLNKSNEKMTNTEWVMWGWIPVIFKK